MCGEGGRIIHRSGAVYTAAVTAAEPAVFPVYARDPSATCLSF